MIKYICPAVLVFILFISCSKNESDKNEYSEMNTISSMETSHIIQENLNIQERQPEKNNTVQNIIDIEENLDEEQEGFFLRLNEIASSMHRDADSDEWELWRDKNRKIIDLLVAFLKISITWSIDITKYFPYITASISNDGMVKIFSWTLAMWGTGDYYNNIIQYKTESGEVSALEIDGPQRYVIGCILKDNVYLLLGGARAGGGIGFNAFKVIEISHNELLPYFAFNGNSELSFFASPREDRTQIYYYDLNFIEHPFSIKFITHDEEYLEFIFSGSEFIGDYEKFNEIRH
jgi:hypothetical protein